jgi:hypothetical protein
MIEPACFANCDFFCESRSRNTSGWFPLSPVAVRDGSERLKPRASASKATVTNTQTLLKIISKAKSARPSLITEFIVDGKNPMAAGRTNPGTLLLPLASGLTALSGKPILPVQTLYSDLMSILRRLGLR